MKLIKCSATWCSPCRSQHTEFENKPIVGAELVEVDIEEDTTTSTVGNYQYDVPFAGDKETLSRNNGVNGSTSINVVKN